MKPMKGHDSFPPDSLFGMTQKLNNLRQNRRDGLFINQLTNSIKRGANDQIVIGFEVLLNGINNQDDQIVILVQEQSDGQIPSSFKDQIVIVGHLDGVDVAKGGVVAEHLDVDETNDILFHLALGDVRFGDAALESLDLVEDNSVFFGFGSGFAD